MIFYPDLPVSVQESPAEVWIDSGLLQGWRHSVQQRLARGGVVHKGGGSYALGFCQRSGSWRSFLRDSFPGGVADLGEDSLEAAQGAPRDQRRDLRGERSPWLPLETRPDSPGEP